MAQAERVIVDKSRILDILKKLQSRSSKDVHNALKEIRSNIIKTSAGIRLLHQCGGLKSLVRLLERPNEKILNITLSILGNCCLEKEFRQEVGDFNVSSSIILILINIESDSIRGRACRLVGNLAKDYNIACQLHENDAVDALLPNLHTCPTSGLPLLSTRQMAVRALGALWCVPERRREMLGKNVVLNVASLLKTDTAPEMLQQILKVLAIFTRTPSQQCASQVNTEGSGFEKLVSCVSNPGLKEFALTCIVNLCSVASVRPQLGSAGAVDILVTEVKETRSKPLLHALCLLSHESVNRAKIREAGGLKILLIEARTQGRCLKSLEHYVYDEPSLMLLLRAGLLSLLTELLAECKPPKPHIPRDRQKYFTEMNADLRSPPRAVSPDSGCCSKSPSSSPNTSPFHYGNHSPMYSPASLSSHSEFDYSESDREEDYSPVCSEDESNTEKNNLEKKREVLTERHMDGGPILTLLTRISQLEPSVVNMASAKTLKALLDYLIVDSDPQSKAAKILTRLCRNPLNFIHVLIANFVPQIHCHLLASDMHSSLGVSLLAQLSARAESRFGEGEIEHCLITSTQIHKENICMAIPHLVRTPKLLKKLLVNCNGLAILVQVFQQSTNVDYGDSLQFSSSSLNALAISLEMSWREQPLLMPRNEETIQQLTVTDAVNFHLDDGSQVAANKSLLSQKSPFFEAMFGGNFNESHQTSIKLPEISKHCLLHVVHLLTTENLPSEMDLTEALELLSALDRFLIIIDPRLINLILSKLSVDSAKVIYEHTATSGNAPVFTFLKENTLKYILSTQLDTKVRSQVFEEWLLKFGNEFTENLDSLIRTQICTKYDLIYKVRCK